MVCWCYGCVDVMVVLVLVLVVVLVVVMARPCPGRQHKGPLLAWQGW